MMIMVTMIVTLPRNRMVLAAAAVAKINNGNEDKEVIIIIIMMELIPKNYTHQLTLGIYLHRKRDESIYKAVP